MLSPRNVVARLAQLEKRLAPALPLALELERQLFLLSNAEAQELLAQLHTDESGSESRENVPLEELSEAVLQEMLDYLLAWKQNRWKGMTHAPG